MKSIITVEFKDLPVDKIQQIIIEILNTLKASNMIDDGKFQIFTPDGIVTEKCILQENKVIA